MTPKDSLPFHDRTLICNVVRIHQLDINVSSTEVVLGSRPGLTWDLNCESFCIPCTIIPCVPVNAVFPAPTTIRLFVTYDNVISVWFSPQTLVVVQVVSRALVPNFSLGFIESKPTCLAFCDVRYALARHRSFTVKEQQDSEGTNRSRPPLQVLSISRHQLLVRLVLER